MNRRSIAFSVALVVLASSGASADVDPVLLNDGNSHVINDLTHQRDPVRVRDAGCEVLYLDDLQPCLSPGAPTRLELSSGAAVGFLLVADSSTVAISGGRIEEDVETRGSATVLLSAGSVQDDLEARGSSTITMTGGRLEDEVEIDDVSTLEISGGTVEAETLWVGGFSAVTISGGAVSGRVIASDSSTVTVSGGLVGTLWACTSSTITIVGSGFAIDGTAVDYGPIVEGGVLTATLVSNDAPVAISVGLCGGTIILADSKDPVPPAPALGLFNDGGHHVINDDTYRGYLVGTRNAGCGSTLSIEELSADCVSPGVATTLVLQSGATVGRSIVADSSTLAIEGASARHVEARDFANITVSSNASYVEAQLNAADLSNATISDGFVSELTTEDFATATMSGGGAWSGVSAEDYSAIVLSGGRLYSDEPTLEAEDCATLIVVGSDFYVDGAEVADGPLAGDEGVLTGKLFSGDRIAAAFERDHEAAIILTAGPPPTLLAPGSILLSDGGSHTVEGIVYQDDLVTVRNDGCGSAAAPWSNCPSAGLPTTLDLASSAVVGHLRVGDSSTVTMTASSLAGSLESAGAATIAVSGGTVRCGLEVDDSSTVTMSGGVLQRGMGVGGLATATISGGEVYGDLEAGDFATVEMSGGTIEGGLGAGDFATVEMSGGTIEGAVEAYDLLALTIRGGTLGGALVAFDSSIIVIEGSDFMVDTGSGPRSVDYGDLTDSTGTLTGTLAWDGQINSVFYQGESTEGPCSLEDLCSGTICLEDPKTEERECPLPEPTHMLLHSCALITLGLLRRREARRAPPRKG